MVAGSRHSFGTIVFAESQRELIHPVRNQDECLTIERTPGIWEPSDRLSGLRDAEITLQIDRLVGADGAKRYEVPCGLGPLVSLAAPIGLEMILETYGRDQEREFSYRRMALIHRAMSGASFSGKRGSAFHLMRRFCYSRDLFIRVSGRDGGSVRDILPDSVGLNGQGEGRKWSVTELICRGREAAFAACYANPTTEVAITFGFLEAARLNPLYLPSDEVLPLIRTALFALEDSGNPLSEETLDKVTERLLVAINKRKDYSREKFERWLFGAHSNIPRQLAEQKLQRGGKLRQDDVARALRELGWRAFKYVGDCVHVCMHCIQQSIPDEMTDEERHVYENAYESQGYLGDLPLAMIAERMDFLRPALLALWQEMNVDNAAVLLRMIEYYSQMAAVRRAADRIVKNWEAPQDTHTSDENNHSTSSTESHPGRMGVLLVDNLCSEIDQRGDLIADVAEHFRELCHVECENGCSEWDTSVSAKEDQVTFTYHCGCREYTVKVASTEVAQVVKEFLKKEEE